MSESREEKKRTNALMLEGARKIQQLQAEVERLKEENERIEFEKTEYFESARNSGMKYIEIEKERDRLLAEKKKIMKAIDDRNFNKIAEWEFMDIIKGLK